jgi:NAD(P)-dependent dehydrogenase (short-subunit alcohol dehydrogenase family)
MPNGQLDGRVAVITGASSGLGAHMAKVFAREGARVALLARRADRLEALAAQIVASGGKALAVPCDVAHEDQIIAAFDRTESALGPVDTVFNNAGLNVTGLAVDLPVEDFDQIMSINLRAVFLVAREAARRMMKSTVAAEERGRIVNVASIGAFNVLPGIAGYCASKAGVVMLTKALAREWARSGISVNAICPGYIETEINADWLSTDGGQRMLKGFARRRLLRAEDLDGLTLQLSSDASRYVTGSIVTIDDGQSL